MEFEFWWLIAFPVFFGLGWLAARIDIKHLVTESRSVPRSYFKGLNFLLNEQPDKAIEAFIEVVKVDPETVELHFALGSLFRRRGETERAIRMHQNLLDRSDLAAEQRRAGAVRARPGLPQGGAARPRRGGVREAARRAAAARRARSTCSTSTSRKRTGRRRSRSRAALEKETGQSWQKEIAEFHCELAAVEATHSRPDAARAQLERGAQGEPQVRAREHPARRSRRGRRAPRRGDRALEAGRDRRTRRTSRWSRSACSRASRRSAQPASGLTLLRGYLAHYPSLDLLDVVFQSTLDAEGAEAAYELVRDELRRNPTLLGLDKLLEAQLLDAPAERRHDLELVRNLVHGQTRRLARYRCENCGFRRASSTGSARRASAGRPIRRGGPRSSILRRDARIASRCTTFDADIRAGDDLKITMIGTGYVGLVSGACLADVGNDVLCLDVDARKIAALERRRASRSTSRACAEMVERNRAAGRLRFTTDAAASVAHGAVQFIAVGTPPGRGRLGRPAARGRRRAQHRPPHDRPPRRGRQVHRAGRHRRRGARRDRRGARAARRDDRRSAWSRTRSS